MDEISVIKWVSSEEIDQFKEAPTPELGGFFGWAKEGGGRDTGKRWDDYIKAFKPEARPYLEAIRKSVLERKLTYTGDDHQNQPDGCPVFNDNTVTLMSWRAWGDLMAAIWSTEENKDYCYMDFYMGTTKGKKDDQSSPL